MKPFNGSRMQGCHKQPLLSVGLLLLAAQLNLIAMTTLGSFKDNSPPEWIFSKKILHKCNELAPVERSELAPENKSLLIENSRDSTPKSSFDERALFQQSELALKSKNKFRRTIQNA